MKRRFTYYGVSWHLLCRLHFHNFWMYIFVIVYSYVSFQYWSYIANYECLRNFTMSELYEFLFSIQISSVPSRYLFLLCPPWVHFFFYLRSSIAGREVNPIQSKMLLCSLSQLDDSRRGGIKRWSKRCWRYHDRNWFVLMFHKSYSLSSLSSTSSILLLVDTV